MGEYRSRRLESISNSPTHWEGNPPTTLQDGFFNSTAGPFSHRYTMYLHNTAVLPRSISKAGKSDFHVSLALPGHWWSSCALSRSLWFYCWGEISSNLHCGNRTMCSLHCDNKTMCSLHCGNRTMCTVATRTRIIFCATLWSKYSQNSGNLSQEDESSGFKTTFCFHRTKVSIWAAAAYLGQGLLSPDKSQGQHLSSSIICGVGIWLKHYRPRSSKTITQNVMNKMWTSFSDSN